MLTLSRGRSHDVFTGVAVARDREMQSAVDATAVTMREMAGERSAGTSPAASRWIGPAPTRFRAARPRFVTGYQGAYDNVVGLPVALVRRLLAVLGRR